MFIRTRKGLLKNGKVSVTYQLVKSVRLGQKVKSRVVCGLEQYPTIGEAVKRFQEKLTSYQRVLDREKQKRVYAYRKKAQDRRLVYYQNKINKLETKLNILSGVL